ncbi:zinc finger BED domain-containing protein RICESLEEPER 2 [Tanacetum coccineum]
MEDQTIHLNSDETNKDDDNNKKHDNKKNGNKRKRKPGGGIGNETADCWKYFDPKMERPDGPDGPLVKMAHYILSIQISTVASESAFSTSGRILDPYRNALSSQIVEALLCTQSWVRTSQKNIYMDDLEDLMKDEEVVKEMKEALDKLKGATGNVSLD